MIAFDKSNMIEGVTVYDDHLDPAKFYALPAVPRFRLDESKKPVFKFLKYRFPIDRPDGKKGGAFLIFDVELALDDQLRERVRGTLQERVNTAFPNVNPKPQAQIGTLRPISTSPLGKPAATVQLLDSGGTLLQRVQNPGQPSLFGTFVTPITVELSPEGATLAEQALQGHGGAVRVAYNLPMVVRVPPIQATVDFWASKFMSFHQEVNIAKNIWGTPRSRHERINEFFSSSESARVHIESGMVTDQKVISAVTDWAWAALDDAVKKMVLKDIDPVKDDPKKVDEALSNLTRDVMVSRMVDFHRVFRQDMAMDFDPEPQGTLVNITNIPSVKWSDYAQVVDLNDPFFNQLNVVIQANADFQNLPIFSVDVNVQYGNNLNPQTFTLKSPNDVGRFVATMEGDNRNYKYSYKVRYKGLSQIFESPVKETNETSLTINAGDTGILTVEIMPGDIDFDEVRSAQVTMVYELAVGPPVEQMFILDKAGRTVRFQKVLKEPVTKPYKYKVKYQMKNGNEFQTDWAESRSPTLMIEDVWNAIKTVGIRGRGNFDTDVDAILLDLTYTDAVNRYSQTKSVTLTKDAKFFDWQFPVISETGGVVAYSGTIKYRNNREEPIAETETTANAIVVGPTITRFIEVEVLPDMIDFAQVKLVTISVFYTDATSQLKVKKELVFRADAAESQLFRVPFNGNMKTAYEWQAQFLMNDGSIRTTPVITGEDLTLLPQLSDAV